MLDVKNYFNYNLSGNVIAGCKELLSCMWNTTEPNAVLRKLFDEYKQLKMK